MEPGIYISKIEFDTITKRKKISWKYIMKYKDYLISDKTIEIGLKTIDVVKFIEKKQCYRIIAVSQRHKHLKYRSVYFYEKRKKTPKNLFLHRVRLTAHVREPEKGEVCRHIDGNAINNDLSNLGWGTHKENVLDAVRKGVFKGENQSSAKINDFFAVAIYVLANLKLVDSRIHSFLEISSTQVYNIKNRKSWSHVAMPEIDKIIKLANDCIEDRISKESMKIKTENKMNTSKFKKKVKTEIQNLLENVSKL